jgi:hypothetical protein
MDGTFPIHAPDEESESLAEFFARIEKKHGPVLTAEDHRLIVDTIRSDRDRDG